MSVSLESIMQGSPVAAARTPLMAELASFVLVGGIAAVSFVVLSTVMIGLDSGVPDWIVSAFCYALFIVPVYLAHRRLSFRSNAPHRMALPRYVVVQISALVLASVFSFVCYGLLGMQTSVAAALVIILTSGVNFVVLKVWAFAHRG